MVVTNRAAMDEQCLYMYTIVAIVMIRSELHSLVLCISSYIHLLLDPCYGFLIDHCKICLNLHGIKAWNRILHLSCVTFLFP